VQQHPPLKNMCIHGGIKMSEKILSKIGFTVTLPTDFQTALDRVAEALKTEGFGILTEIDVKETLKKKLDVDFRPYKILGACNPPLAYRALTAAPQVGLLLPCNVTVSQTGDGLVEVSLIDPMSMLMLIEDEALKLVAREARERLERVAVALSA
jgi:uncharacterized protein (DUF302 family)